MKPSKLYKRDFKILTSEEEKIKKEYLERLGKPDLLNLPKTNELPLAIKHNLSLFPNNHIELSGLKQEGNIAQLNVKFLALIDNDNCLERDVLNFINNTPAYHIVGSILHHRFPFGHHDLYLFKEFSLGSDYRTDYVLIGKGSGGYQFVLIEFEKPEGRITLKNGHFGEAFRKGKYQVEDWQNWMDGNSATFFSDLESIKGNASLPEEFKKYDSTRFHYVVVGGRRTDFSPTTYRSARREHQKDNIYILHHDNLYDDSVALESANSF